MRDRVCRYRMSYDLRCIVCFVTERPKLLGSLDVLLGVPITVTLVSVAVVTEWLSPIHVCVIGTLARGPLGVVAGKRTPVSSTLDRASGGSLLCGPHGRTHELNVFANRAIGS